MPETSAVDRIFSKDPSFWSADVAVQRSITGRLGWLDAMAWSSGQLGAVHALAEEVQKQGVQDIVQLGMGGSSLAPEVFARASGSPDGYPRMHTLDSTSPERILAVRSSVDAGSTLVVVSSKSGETVETLSLYRYFLEQFREAGMTEPATRFIAITDPGTFLHREAESQGFRACFLNAEDIGGRFSALSLFGLVPAAMVGVDVQAVIRAAEEAREACAAGGGGAALGQWLADAYLQGRDKLALVLPESDAAFGAWIEQLLAESLGKGGKGILPYLCKSQDMARRRDGICVEWRPGFATPEVSSPWARSELIGDVTDLGRHFFNWEFATAVVGGLLAVNPFDEPDVASSKANTSRLLHHDSLDFPDSSCWSASDAGEFLAEAKPGEYVAILAYMPINGGKHASEIRLLKQKLEALTRVPVTLGEGPRYLHSTGQYHKGGPDTGRFLVVVDRALPELVVPGESHDFGTLLLAQALGDYQALCDKGRRVMLIERSAISELLAVL